MCTGRFMKGRRREVKDSEIGDDRVILVSEISRAAVQEKMGGALRLRCVRRRS